MRAFYLGDIIYNMEKLDKKNTANIFVKAHQLTS